MQCGPYRVVSLMSREAADELGLEPGVTAVASVKSTNVVVEITDDRSVTRRENRTREKSLRAVRGGPVRGVVAVLAATAVLLAGCSSSSKGGSSSTSASASGTSSAPAGGGGSALKGSITVYAAASLTEAFGTLKTDFVKANPGTSITFNFGASSDLSTQIKQGAPVDVFASASTKNMTSLGSAALSPTTFVKNTAEIAVPPNNPGKITGVKDLGQAPASRSRSATRPSRAASLAATGLHERQGHRQARRHARPTSSPPSRWSSPVRWTPAWST